MIFQEIVFLINIVKIDQTFLKYLYVVAFSFSKMKESYMSKTKELNLKVINFHLLQLVLNN
jgi:hypothetical protein